MCVFVYVMINNKKKADKPWKNIWISKVLQI